MATLEYLQEGPDHICRNGSVSLRYSRVHEARDDITGMLRITLESFPGRDDGDVFDGRIVLTGSTSIRSAAKDCESRIPEMPDWYGIIAKSCQMVRAALGEGTPIENLGAGDIQPEAPSVVDPLIRSGEATLLFGSGGTAKSTIALAIAMLVTVSRDAWGFTTTKQGKVLYLDYEDEADNQRRRLDKLAAGLSLAKRPDVLYKRAEASLPQLADALSRQIAREHITGLITDSAGLACGIEPETADSANAYFRSLRSLRLDWSLTVAHQPKAKERDPLPFGSVYWWNNPRSIWQTMAARHVGDTDLHVALWQRKSNNSALHAPLSYRVTYEPLVTSLAPEATKSVPEFRRSLPAGEQILGALSDAQGEPVDYAELEKITGVGNDTLRQAMRRLGPRVEKVENGFILH